MSRGLGPRVRRLEGRVGWRHVTLTRRDGAEITVPTGLLVDAWINILLGDPSGLPPRLSRFLAQALVREQDGEFLVSLRAHCREVWFAGPTPEQRQQMEDERALNADPPTYPN